MKYIKNNLWLTIISIIFWCILNESFGWVTLVQGLIVAIITLVLIHFLFKDNDTLAQSYHISILSLFRYIITLFINIYKSTFSIIKLIFFCEDHPVIVEINTNVKGDWERCLVANGITLTPGTVTVDKTENKLTVLWLIPPEAQPEEAKAIIQDHFEKALVGKENKDA